MLDDELLTQITVSLLWANRHDWRPGTQAASTQSKFGGLWFVERGRLEACLSGKAWALEAGDALLLPRDTVRERILTDRGAVWWSVGFDVQLFGRLDILPLFRPPARWTPDDATRALLLGWMDQAVQQWPSEAPMAPLPFSQPRDEQARLIGDGLAKAIFGLCWRVFREREAGEDLPLRVSGAPEWLVPALWAVQEDPAITTADLCARFGVSPAHLRRTFHRFVGVAPQAYLAERRLERACRLLQGTHMTVAAVGEAIGFESVHTFSRVFAERFRLPPSKWRERRLQEDVPQRERIG